MIVYFVSHILSCQHVYNLVMDREVYDQRGSIHTKKLPSSKKCTYMFFTMSRKLDSIVDNLNQIL